MEYCGVELTDEGLQHYGVKGMHWGIRRYQPYPGEADGRQLSKHKVRKAMRAIKRNSKRYAQRKWYADKSLGKAFELSAQSDKSKKEGDTLTAAKLKEKSDKQIKDAAKHMKGMVDYKKNITAAIKKIESTGKYEVYAKKGRAKLAGSGNLPIWALNFGALGIGGVVGNRVAKGMPMNGKIYYDKPVLRKTNGVKDPNNTTNALKDTNVNISPKTRQRLLMENEPSIKRYYETNPGARKILDFTDPYKGAGSFNVDASKVPDKKKTTTTPIPGSKSVLKGETKPVTIKPKATSLRTKDGKINTMHPAVNYAIESYSKKSGMSKKQVSDWVRKEGEPPNHDDWGQVIDEYKKKKR